MKRRSWWCENCNKERVAFDDYNDKDTEGIMYFINSGSCAECGEEITEKK